MLPDESRYFGWWSLRNENRRRNDYTRPKPMIEIGGRPILWHIMKTYCCYGITDFVVCCGYKGYMIKEYFFNYSLHLSDVTIDMRDGSLRVHQNSTEPWTVTLIDTGGAHGDEMTHTGRALSGRRGFLFHIWRWRERRRYSGNVAGFTGNQSAWQR